MDVPQQLSQQQQALNDANLQAASQARTDLNDQVIRSISNFQWGSRTQPADLPALTDPNIDGSATLKNIQDAMEGFSKTMAGKSS